MRYVLVGTGNISKTYVAALAELAGSELVGCVSRRLKSPKGAPELPCWSELPEVDCDYDAVILATPNGLHHEGAISAAALGKHVLTEKPLDISATAMEKMTAACANAGVTLAVCYQRRTSPDNQAIKALLERDALGRVFAADLSAKFYRDQAYYDRDDYRGGKALDGGGPFMQQACHNLDLYTWFFGLPDKVVSMLGTFTHNIEAEDHGAALLRHGNGMIGTVVASSAAKPGFSARLEVHTDRGSFTLTDDVVTAWHVDGVANPASAEPYCAHSGATSAAVSDTRAHQAVIRDFETAVRTGREPLAGAASARLATELILQVYGQAV